jgi:uncharacterized protein (DUF111 family)
MEFFTTKIVDEAVAEKIDLKEILKVLSDQELPDSIEETQKLIITFVARANNDFHFEAWQKAEKLYMTIPINFEDARNQSIDQITDQCIALFQFHINNLSIEA